MDEHRSDARQHRPHLAPAPRARVHVTIERRASLDGGHVEWVYLQHDDRRTLLTKRTVPPAGANPELSRGPGTRKQGRAVRVA